MDYTASLLQDSKGRNCRTRICTPNPSLNSILVRIPWVEGFRVPRLTARLGRCQQKEHNAALCFINRCFHHSVKDQHSQDSSFSKIPVISIAQSVYLSISCGSVLTEGFFARNQHATPHLCPRLGCDRLGSALAICRTRALRGE